MYWLIFLFLLALAPDANATKYWVAAAGGSGTPVCGNIDGSADPGSYATLAGVWSCVASGDTIHLKAGTYSGAQIYETTISVPNGTAGNPTIIEGEGVASTILTLNNNGINLEDPSYITIRLMELDGSSMTAETNCIRIADNGGVYTGTSILLEDLKIHHCGDSGVFARANISFVTLRRVESYNNGTQGNLLGAGGYLQGDDTLVEYSSFHDNGNASNPNSPGVQCFNSSAYSDGRADRCTVRFSKFYNNYGNGLALEGNDDVIYRNEMYGNIGSAGDGITFGYENQASRALIYHNTVYGNASNGIRIGAFSAANDSKIINNLVTNNTGTEIVTSGTGITISNNACTASESCGSTGKLSIANVSACTVSTSNFTLKASSSCINAGVSITGYLYNSTAPDIGAYETFVFSVCSVEDGDASNLRITYENNVAPPLLPSTGVTGITARKAGASDTVSTGTRVGDNRVDRTLTDAIANGNTVDISTAATNLTDSSLVGNVTNQPYVQTLTNQSCTNNVGAAASHLFIQAKFEFHGLRGTEAAPVILPYSAAAENTNINVVVGGKARLRIALQCTTADCPPTGFFLRYACASCTTAGTYTVVPDSFATDEDIAFCGTGADPDIPTSGAPTTDQTSATGTFVPASLVRSSNAIPTIDMAQNNKSEPEYCLAWDTDAVANRVYTFRVYQQDGTALDTYTVTPQATVRAMSAGLGF